MAIRLDTVTEMDPGSPEPCGTRAELKRAKLPLLKYGSCSEPTKKSRGCKHFNHPSFGPCPIRSLLARRSRPGPENVGFIHITSPTVWKRDMTTCHNYMDNYEHEDPKGGQTHIIAIGGDNQVLKIRGSEVVDPGNPRSMSRTVFTPTKVPKFLRPSESMADRLEILNMSEEITRAQALRSGEVLSGSLDGGDDEPLSSAIDPDEDGEISLDDADDEADAEADEVESDDDGDDDFPEEPALIRKISTGSDEREPRREPSTKPTKRGRRKAGDDAT